MIELVSSVVTALGIGGSAGLNAYLTLLLVGLLARLTDLVTFREPFGFLQNEWFLGVLVVLVLVELFVDKVPGLDTMNDVIGTAIRPVAGAILVAASGNAVSDVHPILGGALGLAVAGTVHLGKAAVRPPVQAMTGGFGGAILSAIEDVLVIVTVLLAVFTPLLALAVFVAVVWLFFRWFRSHRARRQPDPA